MENLPVVDILTHSSCSRFQLTNWLATDSVRCALGHSFQDYLSQIRFIEFMFRFRVLFFSSFHWRAHFSSIDETVFRRDHRKAPCKLCECREFEMKMWISKSLRSNGWTGIGTPDNHHRIAVCVMQQQFDPERTLPSQKMERWYVRQRHSLFSHSLAHSRLASPTSPLAVPWINFYRILIIQNINAFVRSLFYMRKIPKQTIF